MLDGHVLVAAAKSEAVRKCSCSQPFDLGFTWQTGTNQTETRDLDLHLSKGYPSGF